MKRMAKFNTSESNCIYNLLFISQFKYEIVEV